MGPHCEGTPPIPTTPLTVISDGQVRRFRAFVNTRLLVHKHVKISVDEWILETTRPQKTCQIFGTIYSINFQSKNQTLEGRKMKNVALFWQYLRPFLVSSDTTSQQKI